MGEEEAVKSFCGVLTGKKKMQYAVARFRINPPLERIIVRANVKEKLETFLDAGMTPKPDNANGHKTPIVLLKSLSISQRWSEN